MRNEVFYMKHIKQLEKKYFTWTIRKEVFYMNKKKNCIIFEYSQGVSDARIVGSS